MSLKCNKELHVLHECPHEIQHGHDDSGEITQGLPYDDRTE